MFAWHSVFVCMYEMIATVYSAIKWMPNDEAIPVAYSRLTWGENNASRIQASRAKEANPK